LVLFRMRKIPFLDFSVTTVRGKAFVSSPIVRQMVVPVSTFLCAAWEAVNTEQSDAVG